MKDIESTFINLDTSNISSGELYAFIEELEDFLERFDYRIDKLKIRHLFYENEFSNLVEYFNSMDIKYVKNISSKDLEGYFKLHEQDIHIVYKRLLFLRNVIMAVSHPLNDGDIDELASLQHIYYEREFRDFIDKAEEKGIVNIFQLEKSIDSFESPVERRLDLLKYILNIRENDYIKIESIKIKNLLNKTRHKGLLKLLEDEKLVYVEQLTGVDLDLLLKGSYIRDNVKEDIKLIYLVYNAIKEELIAQSISDNRYRLNIYRAFYHIKLSDLFFTGKSRAVKRYFVNNKIELVENVFVEDFKSMKGYYGIGRKKLEYAEKIFKIYYNYRDMLIGDNLAGVFIEGIMEENIYDIDTKKSSYEFILKEIDLSQVFREGKYALILEYFEENNIVTMNDISDRDILNIKNKKGIGEKKFNDFINRLDSFVIDQIKSFNIDSFVDIIEYYGDEKINRVLGYLSLGEMTKECRFEDLIYMDFDKDLEESDKIKLFSLLKKLKDLKDINVLLELSLAELEERDLFIINSRLVEDRTLQEIGDTLDLSRERVRQIEKNILNRINRVLLDNKIFNTLKLKFENPDYFRLEELDMILEKPYKFLISFIRNNHLEEVYYMPQLDRAYFYNISNTIERLDKLVLDWPNYERVYFYIEELESFLYMELDEEIESEELLKVIRYYEFKPYGDYISKGKLNYSDMVAIVFRDYIRKPIRIDEDSKYILEDYIYEVFNQRISKDERNIRAVLDRDDDILLCESKTYCHINYLNNDVYLLNKIKDFIDDYFYNHSIINTELIFEKFKKDCLQSGIDNKIYLYSLIKYNFSEQYEIGQGNTLSIKPLGEETHISKEKILINYVDRQSGIKVKKDRVNEELGWSRENIENTLAKCEELVSIDSRYIGKVDKLFKGSEREVLLRTSYDLMKDGYTTAYVLYNKLKKNPIGMEFIRRNDILEYSTIANIVKSLNPKVKGHTNLIYFEDSRVKTISDMVIRNTDGVIERLKLQNYLYDMGYKIGMVGLHISNMIESDILRELSVDCLIKTEDFNLSKDIADRLETIVLNLMKGRDYLGLNKQVMDEINRRITNVDYKLTPHFVRSALLDRGFKRLKRTGCDYRYELIVVVKENIGLGSFDQLCSRELKDQFKDRLPVDRAYDYLGDLGLLDLSHGRNNKLPYELEISELFKIDSNGILYLI